MAHSKLDKEIENFIEKNWKMLLGIGAVAFVWFSKEKILTELMKLVPTVVGVFRGIALLILLGIIIRIVLHGIYLYLEKKRYRYVLFIPHIDDEVTPDKLGQMIRHVHGSGRKPLERLLKGRDWYRMTMYRPEGENERVRFYVGGPEDKIKQVVQAIQSAYTHSEIYTVQKKKCRFQREKR